MGFNQFLKGEMKRAKDPAAEQWKEIQKTFDAFNESARQGREAEKERRENGE